MLLHVCPAVTPNTSHVKSAQQPCYLYFFLLLCFILSQTCCSCYLIPIKPDSRSYVSYVWPGFCWIHYGAHFVFLLLLYFKGQFCSFPPFSVVYQMERLSYCVQLSSALQSTDQDENMPGHSYLTKCNYPHSVEPVLSTVIRSRFSLLHSNTMPCVQCYVMFFAALQYLSK